MGELYDPNWVAGYFDAYGVAEWDRLVRNPTDEVRLAVHAHYLREHVRADHRVLDIGAGAGRFTQILVEIGARVVVADISPVQLDLNRRYAAELGFEPGVEDWVQTDMCQMDALEDEGFDVVVAYGGPLSYVFERRVEAIDELRRVLRPGGTLLVSVMSLWGSVHEYLPAVLGTDPAMNSSIVATGDLHPGADDATSHRCHLYRLEELRDLLASAGFEQIIFSASNCLAAVWRDRLAEVRQDPARWRELVEMEIEACAQPGCLEMGTHLIAAARKPAP